MKHFSDLAIQLVAESKIQQAYDDGQFDQLPGFGKPLPFEADGRLPSWTESKLQREQIKFKNQT